MTEQYLTMPCMGGFTASINASTGEVAAVTDESTVISGTSGKSVKFALDSASTWGGGYLQNVAGVDASSYTSLSFDVNLSQLDSSVDFLQFKLEDTAGGATADALNLYDLAETATTGDWKSYTVYLANYNIIDFSKFKAIGFWHPKVGATYTPGTFYVDNVEFGTATATPYTVTYNANPGSETLVGSLSRTSDTVDSGSTIASAPDGFSITGYTLKGWNTEPGGGGTDFVFGTTPVNGDITLYAQWEMVVAFTGILFDDALQNGFAASINASTGEVAAVTDESTVISGTSGKSVKFELNSASTWGGGYLQNVAGVDASSYTSLSFDVNLSQLNSSVDFLQFKLEDTAGGATADALNLYDLAETATTGDWKSYTVYLANYNIIDFSKFKAIGFWHPKVGATYTPGTFYVDNVEFGTAAPPSYTVTYNANGADGGTLSKTTDTVDDGGTISTAPTGITKTGYTLSGWNTQADGGGTDFVFGTTAVNSDITLYAKWTMDVVDTVDNRYYFLGDATGVDTPEMEGSGMTHFGGYDNTITFTTEASGGADSTSGYFKLVGSESQGWAAGGWGDGPYIDFTGYDTLVFWAKVPGTPTAGKIAATQVKFVLTSRHRTSGGDVGGPIITRPDGSNFTTTWTKYEIPLTEITIDANFMQEAIKEFKYEFLGNNHELHLDEVYLRASGNAPALAVTAVDSSKAIDENPSVDTELENIAKLTTVTAGATLSYRITDQSAAGAMSIDPDTGVLKVADATPFVYATNQQLTATVEVSADDGSGTPATDSITVTIKINNPAVAPTDAPTAPTTAAADVINLFSDTYAGTAATQIDVTNWNPGWNQATVYSEETIAGNTVMKYSNLNYQGIEFTNEDVSGKTKVHFDLWTADETSFQFVLIAKLLSNPGGQGEHAISVESITPITANQWNSYDITLSDYTAANTDLDLSKLFQIKIVGSGNIDGQPKRTVFLDNIYFY